MKRRLLIALALLLILNIPFATAQDTDLSPELEQQFSEMNETTTSLRGLELINPLDLRFPTRPEVREYLEGALEETLTEEQTAEYNAFYTAYEFLSPDADIRNIVLDLYEQQVAGYYDPVAKTMNVILSSGEQPTNRLPVLEQIIYVHELVHTLQDQHFDLELLLADLTSLADSDRALAGQALFEGDATFIMNIYTQQIAQENPLGTLLGVIVGGAQAGNLTVPAGTPEILTAELLFPYNDGANFVSYLYSQGGWDAVNAAFGDLPVSSEQIYHPEKYVAGEMPQTVTLEDVSEHLGSGWTLISDGTFGEFYLRQYLAHTLNDAAVDTAAAGWGGDQYQVYVAEGGQVAQKLRIAWDTPTDADEFAAAWDDFAMQRADVDALTDGCAVSEAMTYCLRFMDDHTQVSSAPTLELALALVNSN